MRGRLFWKILLGFWITLIAITQVLWLLFTFYNHHERPESGIAQRYASMQVNTAAVALQGGGLPALDEVINHWSDGDKQLLTVEPVVVSDDDDSQDNKPVHSYGRRGVTPNFVTSVQGPDGQSYRLTYNVEKLIAEYAPKHRSQRFLNIPPPFLWMGGVGGLLFSAVLAFNLTRPMLQMRKAFDRVAQGDLSVRLYASMAKRHDEISVVARDFDSMVERLQVLVKAREELLHDVSHELRSPLARLQLAIGLARQNPSNVESSLTRIDHEAGRLDKMIGELLVLSRTQNSSIPDEEYFDLLGLVEAVVFDARYEAQIPEVEIELNVKDAEQQDYTVKGNAELMRRAIDNVVRNALRFSGRGQKVSVTLTSSEHVLKVDVADQGPGVEEDKLSSIFDPFVRVKSPLSGKGYGLGLAITKKVVVAHKGKVDAHNGASGGLVISLQVPHWKVTA